MAKYCKQYGTSKNEIMERKIKEESENLDNKFGKQKEKKRKKKEYVKMVSIKIIERRGAERKIKKTE